jgi:hypothetical protein
MPPGRLPRFLVSKVAARARPLSLERIAPQVMELLRREMRVMIFFRRGDAALGGRNLGARVGESLLSGFDGARLSAHGFGERDHFGIKPGQVYIFLKDASGVE